MIKKDKTKILSQKNWQGGDILVILRGRTDQGLRDIDLEIKQELKNSCFQLHDAFVLLIFHWMVLISF